MIARNKSLKSSVPHHFPTTFRISELPHHFPITPSSIIKSPHALFPRFRDSLVGQPIIVTILLLLNFRNWIPYFPLFLLPLDGMSTIKLHKVSVEAPPCPIFPFPIPHISHTCPSMFILSTSHIISFIHNISLWHKFYRHRHFIDIDIDILSTLPLGPFFINILKSNFIDIFIDIDIDEIPTFITQILSTFYLM